MKGGPDGPLGRTPLVTKDVASFGRRPEAPGHSNLQMAGLISARFRAGMRPLAIGTGLCVALSAPLADFLLERHDLSRRATRTAAEVAGLIAQSPSGARPELLDVVQRYRSTRGGEDIQQLSIFDGRGELWLASSAGPHRWPVVQGEAPTTVERHPGGVVRVTLAEREWLDRDFFLLSLFGALGLVLGLALYWFPLRLFREEDLVQLFARRSIKAAEEERLRLSRDLHDGIGQALGAAAVALVRLVARRGASPETEETSRLVDAALNELRQVTQGLRPPSLDDLGIGAAVEALARAAERTGLAAKVDIQPLPRLDSELEETCFRLAQEALANIIHHARATTFRLTLLPQGEQVLLEVQDDGQGFSPSSGMGIGLVGARERAARLRGTLTVESVSGGGTLLRAVLPIG